MKKTKRRPQKVIPNPFYADIRKHGVCFDIEGEKTEQPPTLGRPRNGDIRLPTAVRSVRLPKALWTLVQAQARREGVSINAAMRQAAQIWLRS